MLANCISFVSSVRRSNIYVKSHCNWQTDRMTYISLLFRHRIINCIRENIKSALFSQNLGHECFLIRFCSPLICRLVSDKAGEKLWIKSHVTTQATPFEYFRHFRASTVFNYFVLWNLSFSTNKVHCVNGHLTLSLTL